MKEGSLFFFDVDRTAGIFDEHVGYRAAAQLIARGFPSMRGDLLGAMLEQFQQLLNGNGNTCLQVRDMFASHAHRELGVEVPGEASWSRFGAFLVLLEAAGENPRHPYTREVALHAECGFWEAVTAEFRPYDDAVDFFCHARRRNIVLQPISSSDMRVSGLPVCYDPRESTRRKMIRMELGLGRGLVRRPIIFEEYAKASLKGWQSYALNGRGYTMAEIGDGVIIGDSLSDVKAGRVMGMQVCILIDRDNQYGEKPDEATHLVQSFSQVPAILGWT